MGVLVDLRVSRGMEGFVKERSGSLRVPDEDRSSIVAIGPLS